MSNEKSSRFEHLELICSSFRSPTWRGGIVMNEILLAMLPRMSQVYIASMYYSGTSEQGTLWGQQFCPW